jgi:hypothetical protein
MCVPKASEFTYKIIVDSGKPLIKQLRNVLLPREGQGKCLRVKGADRLIDPQASPKRQKLRDNDILYWADI